MVAVDRTEWAEGIAEEARRADLAARDRLEKYASRYSLRRMFTDQNRLLLDSLGSGARLLEVGCGIGNFLVDAVREPRPFAQVHSVEVGIETARIARSHASAVSSILLAPAESLPYRDRSFDAVVARGVLHHMADPAAAIGEMHRVLSPGGRLVILEGNPASRYRRLLLGIADALHMPHEDTQFRHLHPSEIAERLSLFGRTRWQSVNGLFAPLAYVGVGGERVWNVLSRLTHAVERWMPNRFSWWLLWMAQK